MEPRVSTAIGWKWCEWERSADLDDFRVAGLAAISAAARRIIIIIIIIII